MCYIAVEDQTVGDVEYLDVNLVAFEDTPGYGKAGITS